MEVSLDIKHKWYVVNCHSGYEKKVADAIMDEAKQEDLESSIIEVSVPTQAVVEVRRGVRINSEKKFFPGYVLVKMQMNDDTWHLVKDIPKVSNFLGVKNKPLAISEKEVSKLLQDITEGAESPKPKFEYEVGEQIKVSDGPFASFSGIIEEVDSSRQKLKVSVSIFGRPTPLELDYSQVVKG
jgi:transcriptional antiterminator NusG